MTVNEFYEAYTNATGAKTSDMAEYLGISVQSMHNKKNRKSLSFEDFTKLIEGAGGEISIKFPEKPIKTKVVEKVIKTVEVIRPETEIKF